MSTTPIEVIDGDGTTRIKGTADLAGPAGTVIEGDPATLQGVGTATAAGATVTAAGTSSATDGGNALIQAGTGSVGAGARINLSGGTATVAGDVLVEARSARYTLANAAPPDALLGAGDFALWLDATNGAGKLMVKAKTADGTVATAAILLT